MREEYTLDWSQSKVFLGSVWFCVRQAQTNRSIANHQFVFVIRQIKTHSRKFKVRRDLSLVAYVYVKSTFSKFVGGSFGTRSRRITSWECTRTINQLLLST